MLLASPTKQCALKFHNPVLKYLSKMSVFVQKLNPITGNNDWVVQNEDYDYHQEVARSSFADMLHDTERNQLYEKALQKAISIVHSKNKKANVLDIGTGTGLLSMMAVRHGADSVTACEAFKPMSECAVKIIKLNGLEDKITVIPKRSTELTVGENGDLRERCNILVTEVFDTELIGEGALSTFTHAHAFLLVQDCIVVPSSATMYAQVVECPLVQNWNKFKDIFDDEGEILIRVPPSVKNCRGSAAVHDIQLSQVPLHSVNTIVPPTAVFQFDWSGKEKLEFSRCSTINVKVRREGKAQAVFMWWDLQMDAENELVLSCAPHWAHPLRTENKPIPWRDHWMQAVYYLPKEINVTTGQTVNLISCHDEYSLWFNLIPSEVTVTNEDKLGPICDCGLHVSYSRTRIGQLNDARRYKKYLSLLEKYVTKDSTVLVLSDGFYISLAASKMGAKKIYCLETNGFSFKLTEEFVKYNQISNVEIISSLEKLSSIRDLKNINLVLGEPYFVSSILPWDNLLYTYLIKGLKPFLSDNVKVLPRNATIKAVAVKFDDLYKIRSPLGVCEGFLMKPFDDLINHSSLISDENVEAQPLWEYPCTAISDVEEISRIDLVNVPNEVLESSGSFSVQGNAKCNGIALWIDWMHDGCPKSTVTTGPVSPVEIGKRIEWDMHTRQGVCLFPSKLQSVINYNFKFDFELGSITFKVID